MNRLRRLITIAGLLALAVAFTGCFTLALVQDDAATQADVMGDVSVDTTACGAPLLAFVAGPRAADAHDSLSDLCPSDEDALDLYFSRSSALPLPGQLLVSYRVPEGATAPGELTATIDYLDFREWLTYVEGGVARRADERPAPHTDHQITFRRSTDLDAKLPAAYAESGDGSSDLEKIGPGIDVLGDGEKLVSYVSVVIPGAVLGDLELETAFGLPSGTRPYAGPFEHLSMAGWRIAMTKEMLPDVVGNRSSAVSRRLGLRGDEVDPIAAATNPDRPIDCTVGASFLAQLSRDERVGRPVDELDRLLKRGPSSTLDITFCPWPKLPLAEGEDLRVDLDKAFAGTETATRDLDLRGSGETFVEQGNAATVPFSLVGAGPAGQKVDLTASISPAIPGLGDIKTEIDFPGAGTHGRSVEIKVPADAPARTYEVLLTAAKGDHTRTAKAGLVVLPKPAAPTVQAASPDPVSKPLTRDNIYVDGNGYIRFGALCGTCTVDVLVPFGSVGGAKAAQASKPRLLRVARASMKGAKGTRTVVKVRLFPRARRAMRDGRTMSGLIVARQGKGTKPEVRRIVIRRKRSK